MDIVHHDNNHDNGEHDNGVHVNCEHDNHDKMIIDENDNDLECQSNGQDDAHDTDMAIDVHDTGRQQSGEYRAHDSKMVVDNN